jgi:hypothetical protein
VLLVAIGETIAKSWLGGAYEPTGEGSTLPAKSRCISSVGRLGLGLGVVVEARCTHIRCLGVRVKSEDWT